MVAHEGETLATLELNMVIRVLTPTRILALAVGTVAAVAVAVAAVAVAVAAVPEAVVAVAVAVALQVLVPVTAAHHHIDRRAAHDRMVVDRVAVAAGALVGIDTQCLLALVLRQQHTVGLQLPCLLAHLYVAAVYLAHNRAPTRWTVPTHKAVLWLHRLMVVILERPLPQLRLQSLPRIRSLPRLKMCHYRD